MNGTIQLNQTGQTTNNAVFNRNIFDHKKNNGITAEIGNIIKATVLDKTDTKTTLKTNMDYSFEVDSDRVKGELGEELFFEVLKSDKEGMSLKQVYPTALAKELTKQSAAINVKEHFKQNNLINEENFLKAENKEDPHVKEMKAISKIKQQLAYASNNTSQSAINELLASGVSLNKISFTMLTNVMHEIEKKPVDEISAKDLKKITDDYFKENKTSPKERGQKTEIIKILAQNDLPLTKNNINSMTKVLEKIKEIKDLDNSAIIKLLKEEKPITLENIYLSKYSSKEGDKALSDETIASLMPEISKFFKREGIEETEEAVETAKFLVTNEVPLTKENMDKALLLKNLNNNVEKGLILDLAAENLTRDKNVMDIPITENPAPNNSSNELAVKYNEILKYLPEITAETIDIAARKKEGFQLDTLVNIYKERMAKKEQDKNFSATGEDVSVSTVTAKRQLAEVQSKLTHEAANRLSKKNIDINTKPLDEAVEQLRNLEKEDYEKNFRMLGVKPTDESIEKISDLYTKLSESKPLTNNVFGNIISRRSDFTIDGIHKSVNAAKLLADYETNQTVPNPKYGDSFNKVKDQFAQLLENLGMEANEMNVKAAAILSRNNLDITPENLTQIKLIDAKINDIYNRLHPNIAAGMIKDGLNPVDMQVDEVIQYIDSFNNEYGDDLSDKISKHIMELDDNKELDDKTRSSMIAVYRMLNQIQKNGGAGIGANYKAENSLTLGNLLESSKYFARTGGNRTDKDVTIDDQFGALEKLNQLDNNIRSILENNYSDMLVKDFTEKSEPKALKELIDQNPDFLDSSLENSLQQLNDISAKMKEALENNDFAPDTINKAMERQTELLKTIANAHPNTIRFMEKNGMDMSLDAIYALQNMVKDSFYLGKKIDKIQAGTEAVHDIGEDKAADEGSLLSIMDTELTPLKEGKSPSELLDHMDHELEEIHDLVSNRDLLEEIKLIQNGIKVQNHMNKNNVTGDGSFSLPVKLHDGISNLNLYVLNAGKSMEDDSKILMSIHTKKLGTVQVDISIKEDNVNVNVNPENPNALNFLKNNQESLLNFIKDSGYNPENVTFGMEKIRNPLEERVNNRAAEISSLSEYETIA